MRAYLIMPPDRPDFYDAACGSGADALVLDAGRLNGDAWAGAIELRERCDMLLYARVGMASARGCEHALSAAMTAQADAIVLHSKCARDVAHLGARLAVHEAESDRRYGQTRIVALIADAESALNVESFARCGARLAAIAWDARAVAADLGSTTFDEAGAWIAPLVQVRGLARLAAAAAGVEAIDDFAACAGGAIFDARLSEARALGFRGILTDDPALIRRIREMR